MLMMKLIAVKWPVRFSTISRTPETLLNLSNLTSKSDVIPVGLKKLS